MGLSHYMIDIFNEKKMKLSNSSDNPNQNIMLLETVVYTLFLYSKFSKKN